MADERDRKRLQALEHRIARARGHQTSGSRLEESHSMASLAWRMVIELVAGLGIGFGIGYGLDMLTDTRPWFMVLFTLLGFAAGVKTMMASAQQFQKRSIAAGTAGDERG